MTRFKVKVAVTFASTGVTVRVGLRQPSFGRDRASRLAAAAFDGADESGNVAPRSA